MTIAEVQREVDHAWSASYSPQAIAQALDSIRDQPVGYRLNHFIARLCFRGIYFPQMGWWAWTKVMARNGETIFKLMR